MKYFLITTLAFYSFSSFALTKPRAIALVKASRSETLSKVKAKYIGLNFIQVNYEILGGIICSSTVKETKNADDLKVFTIKEGFCFQ